jgi:excisionase family DNA binding protein
MNSEPAGAKPVLSYTIPEAVKATGIGKTSLYAEIKAGKLVARKRGSQTLILAEDLRSYLAALPVGGEVTQ